MDTLAIASSIFNNHYDDDFSDRLNYIYTVALLTGFSILLTTRSYGSEVTNLSCSLCVFN
jgi:hypothetical protein